MKAHELRIGNYVEIFGVQKVISINSKKIKVESEKKDGSVTREKVPLFSASLKPIPLTEKWLKKLSPQVKDFGSNTFGIGRFQFIWKASYKYWYVVDDMSEAYITKIEFVHEYQNFCFVMNGQELKLASDSAQI
tara:strand:+ start:274 stop:675 length:402 start_codon:yes stop_codon:yes gene_type:complete